MNTPPRTPAPLPGFSAPAAGFDEPLAMLQACHERVRRSLALLRKVCSRIEEGSIDAAVHEAAADVLRYFDKAAPHHHEDEEQHIFPRVLEHAIDPALRAAVLKLQEDHVRMESQWARLRIGLAALAAGRADGFGAAQIARARRFCALYDGHAHTEEQVVYPLVVTLLDAEALLRMGDEMAARRGAVRPPR